ncbi:MAG: hypothetical protein ACTHLT_01295 [Devosia sp.]
MPTRKPFISIQGTGASRLMAAAAIGFSLTLVAAGLAILLGFVPPRTMVGAQAVDATVLLLFVPLCALTFAILAEAVRATVTGSFRHPVRVHANPLDPWRPGRGEG